MSDPQERAWYDSHRSTILEGANNGTNYSHNTKVTGTEDILRMMMKFSPRIEFTDSSSGFYGAVREAFEQLAKEELNACTWNGLEPVEYPTFGYQSDTFDVIRPFYAIWGSFSTKKTFSWKDSYKLSDAPDRRVRRLMEKENKRLRDDAIREFNDAVRSLASFVKKRDPRFKAAVPNQSDRQRLLREATAIQAARSRAANEAKLGEYSAPQWAQSEEPEDNSSGTETESEQDQFECVVCRKIFKSERQFEAHERSRKHIKALKQLRYEMKKEDDYLQLSGPDIHCEAKTTEEENYGPNNVASSGGENDDTNVYRHEAPHANPSPSDPEPSDHHGENDASLLHDDYTTRGAIESRLFAQHPPESRDSEILIDQGSDDLSAPSEKKLGKAKQKRAKKAAKAAGQKETLACGTCGCEFTSRNKLFSHIAAEKGHAISTMKLKPSKRST